MMPRYRLLALSLLVGVIASGLVRADDPPGGWAAAEKGLRSAVLRKDFQSARSFVDQLAATGEARGYKAIIRYAVGGHDYDLDRTAGGHLVGIADPKGREVVYETVRESKDPRATIVLLAVLARWKDDPAAVDALVGAVGSRHKEVVFAALQRLREVKDIERSVEPLIDELAKWERKPQGRIYWDIRRTLEEITGVELEVAVDWSNWWKGRGGKAPPPKASSKSGRTQVARPPRFFSVTVDSDRVLFLIDVSTSMTIQDTVIEETDDEPEAEKPKGRTVVKGPRRGGGTTTGGSGAGGSGADGSGSDGGAEAVRKALVMRIDRVKLELIRTLRGLPSHVRFGIIGFSHELTHFDAPGSLLFANEANKERAIAWVRELQPSGATRTDLALLESFKVPEVDTVYLLTDGAPRTAKNEKIDPEYVLQVTKFHNQFRRARIHTIGFAQAGHTMKWLCLQLAEQNDGKCVLLQ